MTVHRDERDSGDAVVERLRRDLAEARQQLAATSEVLSALGQSASDLDAVLGTVVRSARSLCRADVAQIHLMEGELLKLARSSGLSQEGIDYMTSHPTAVDRGSLIGRVSLYGRTQQITDVVADPDYGRIEVQRLTGLRTTLGVPMMLGDELIGVLNVWRTEVDPFGDREAEVLTTFATQAAIAIRQVRLHAGPGSPPAGAQPEGRPAGGVGRGRAGRELQPRPRPGACDDHHARGAALGHRRRVDLRVRRCRRGVRPPDRVRHQCQARRCAAPDPYRPARAR